jgi:hypothetical protein
MRRSVVRVLGAILVTGTLVSCDDEDPAGLGLIEQIFDTTLNGANEVPANASTATGVAQAWVVGSTLFYHVEVTGLTNPAMAHIHGPGAPGTNAGILVNLCGTAATPACPTGAPFTGVLASGAATDPAVSFDSLLVLLNNGNAYVNVHTNDNTGAANTGPGDLAAGEIRGQLEVLD